jgi:predicted transcriptional regulator
MRALRERSKRDFYITAIEARMLLKIKAVRRDLRELSGPSRFLILLNLNELSNCYRAEGVHKKIATFKARMLLKTKEA